MKSPSPVLDSDIHTPEVLSNDSSVIAQDALHGKNQGGISRQTHYKAYEKAHTTRIQTILAQQKEEELAQRQENKDCLHYLNTVIDGRLLGALEDISFHEYCDEQKQSILDTLNITMNTTPVEYSQTPKTKKINNKKLVYPSKTIKGKVVGMSDKEDEIIFKMDKGPKYSMPVSTLYNWVKAAKDKKKSSIH